MIFIDLNKKFNKIFIILLIICIFNIILYNYKTINNNKETYMNTNSGQMNNTLSTFKENLVIENKRLLDDCNVKNYYDDPDYIILGNEGIKCQAIYPVYL